MMWWLSTLFLTLFCDEITAMQRNEMTIMPQMKEAMQRTNIAAVQRSNIADWLMIDDAD